MARLSRIGFALFGLTVAVCLFTLVFSPWSAFESDFQGGVSSLGLPMAPSASHWLGTDRLYRDLGTRAAHGAFASLQISLLATGLATAVGLTVGMVAGYAGTRGPFSRLLDLALMRVVDVGLAFPFLLLVLALGTTTNLKSITSVPVILGATSWLGLARVVRAKTLLVSSQDFVVAARALGQNVPALLFRTILPAIWPTVLGTVILLAGQTMLAEAVLSYLGAGSSPPAPSLGRMVFEGQDYLETAPWIVFFPSAILFALLTSLYLAGEGLRLRGQEAG